MFTKLREILLPFAEIARELRALRELYEAELAARVDATGRAAPIYRVSEKASAFDTTVSYGTGPDEPRRLALERFIAGEEEEEEPV